MSGDWGPWWFFERGTTAAHPNVEQVFAGPLHGTWYEARQEACAKLNLEAEQLEWTTDPKDPRIPPEPKPNGKKERRRR